MPINQKQLQFQSTQWYLTLIKNLGMFHRNTKALKESGFGELTTSLEIGRPVMFWYDPKLKDTLPMYDVFPLALPIEQYGDSYLGLNLHYLSPGARKLFFDRLLSLASDPKLPENAKIRARYDLLKGTQKYRAFKPCIKRYLFSHIQSKFLNISPTYWKIAVDLPTQQFRRGSPY